ncbi:Poly(A)-specific ribonuclease [Aphelenchoides fujianensis]|nr:Poly(A)-specific ribonuclease [Aphelenchoides fujianensis]
MFVQPAPFFAAPVDHGGPAFPPPSKWPQVVDPDFDLSAHLRFCAEVGAPWNGEEIKEMRIHGGIRHISPSIFDLHRSLRKLFVGHNLLTSIPPQISRLRSLTCLDLSHNSLAALPAEIGQLEQLVELNLSSNLFAQLPVELAQLYRLQVLDISHNPLNDDLRRLAEMPNSTKDVLYYLMCRMTADRQPMPGRGWRVLKTPDTRDPTANFLVLSYNILSDNLLNPEHYPQCPKWALKWEHRRVQLVHEILHYNPDVVSLQILEEEQYHHYFVHEMALHGFEGVFTSKSRTKTILSEAKRKRVDGCALFWKRDTFALRRHRAVEFSQKAISLHNGCDALIDRVMIKDHVALIAVLEVRPAIYRATPADGQPDFRLVPAKRSKSPVQVPADDTLVGSSIVVSNVHVSWDPEYSDVKLIQSMMLINECTSELERVAKEENIGVQDVPFILAGDFNSFPDSEVLDYILNGRILKNHDEFRHFHGTTALNGISSSEPTDDHYRHELKLETAINAKNPAKTNITKTFKACIDYIFSTPRSLDCLGFLKGVKKKWMTENGIDALPHPLFPSDHIPVVSQYALIPHARRQ